VTENENRGKSDEGFCFGINRVSDIFPVMNIRRTRDIFSIYLQKKTFTCFTPVSVTIEGPLVFTTAILFRK